MCVCEACCDDAVSTDRVDCFLYITNTATHTATRSATHEDLFDITKKAVAEGGIEAVDSHTVTHTDHLDKTHAENFCNTLQYTLQYTQTSST